ncbi:MAG: hypothetical protein HC799_02475 [Limnothrix sp. RL_2_0]|nr:hypothetical protein [Limnothrix sp. RL_2_0]
MANLDQEELELLESVENGEWQSIDNVESEILRYQQIAEQQFKTSINIELSSEEHRLLQQLANSSEQSIISFTQDILRKFLAGELMKVL